MKRYPKKAECETMGLTVGELAELLYPGATFDYAMPQFWVDDMVKAGFDPRGQVVWLYEKGSSFGRPAPLTAEAYMALRPGALAPENRSKMAVRRFWQQLGVYSNQFIK